MTSQRFSDRWRGHMKAVSQGSELAVHRAIRKYGDPIVTIIADGVPKDELTVREMEAVALLGTKVPNGYNLTDGGDGVTGWYAAADESAKASFRQKSRERMIRLHAEGKLSTAPMVAYGRSPEGRARRSAAVRERLQTDATFRAAALGALRNAAGTETHRLAMLAGIARRSEDPVWQQMASDKMKRINTDPVLVAKAAEALAQRNSDPEFQKRRLEKVRLAQSQPSWKKANAEMNKARRKITDEQLPEMQRMLDEGVSQKNVAAHFKCSVSTVVHMKALINRSTPSE